MLKEILTYEILLASRSPRRRSLLEQLGIPFRVVEPGHADEHYPPGLEGGEIARYLADRKSEAYQGPLADRQVLLTADTVVMHGGRELGKPGSREEALFMIRLLSDSTHQVYTGVCLRTLTYRTSFFAATDVTFAPLEADEAQYYVDRCRPFDKAGGYGIQEWIGHVAVEGIRGSFFNVMGLPVQQVYREMKALIKRENQE